MASKYVNVCGRRIKYDSRFDFRPYCYFDLAECEYGIVLNVVDAILCRCRKVFKSADVSSIEREVAELQRRLKVAEDALEGASDAFRFCIEQCELELGPKMIGKLCDDGKAVERALAAIREEGGNA